MLVQNTNNRAGSASANGASVRCMDEALRGADGSSTHLGDVVTDFPLIANRSKVQREIGQTMLAMSRGSVGDQSRRIAIPAQTQRAQARICTQCALQFKSCAKPPQLRQRHKHGDVFRVKWGARVLRVRSVSREEVWASAGVQGAWVGGCGCEAERGNVGNSWRRATQAIGQQHTSPLRAGCEARRREIR